MDELESKVLVIRGKDKDLPPTVALITSGETIAVMEVGGRIGVGTARCNPIDQFNEEVGVRIALIRALKNIVEQHEELWVSRSKTKVEVAEQRAAKKHKK